MRIDQTQKPWLLGTSVAAVVTVCLYVAHARGRPDWPDGGSTIGLWYGLGGAFLMAVAGVLVVVRRTPLVWDIGSRPGWLRAHVWLGALSMVFLLCHTGFRWGGPLERLLWVVSAGVVVTGIVGLGIQHWLPRMLTTRVPCEAPSGYHEQACRALMRRGDTLVDQACGAYDPAAPVDPGMRSASEARRQLRAFYEAEVRPFLSPRTGWADVVERVLPETKPLADPLRAAGLFAKLRGISALAEFRTLLEQLALLCDERRLLAEQQRLAFWLHSWLLLHVPLSVALMVLVTAHAIAALYY